MTSLKQSIRIRCPLEKVVATAEDPKSWESWYVGLSEKETVIGETGPGRRRWPLSVTVCLPFPLTQDVLEHGRGPGRSRWKTRPENETECCRVGLGGVLVVLGARQTWSYEAFESGTKVTAEVDFESPRQSFKGRRIEAAQLECLEGRCLERSLRNLRRLCETGGVGTPIGAGMMSSPA